MDEVFSKILNVLTPAGGSELSVFEGTVEEAEPLSISVDGEIIPLFKKNSELSLKAGDRVLCLFDGDDIYIICKVG